MGKHTLKNQTTPDTPSAGYLHIFPDSADKKLKIIDDTGTVTDLTDTVAVSAETYQFKNVDYTALITDDAVIIDGSANTVDITMPAVSAATKKLVINCINADFTVTINRAGADTIQGATTKTLAVNESITLLADTTNSDWRLI